MRSLGGGRLWGSLALIALTALAAEGLASWVTGRGFLRRVPSFLRGEALPGSWRPEGRESLLEQAPYYGPFWHHPDPRVGIVVRPNADMVFARGRVRSNSLGLRRRPGPEPPSEALRIVVLGASIPFGYGVGDRETLAFYLEEILATAWGGPSPPPACWTVAIPRWSHRNAVHFLLDHWRELDPDLVLYMPFSNDMADTPLVSSEGYRRAWPDPYNPLPLSPVNQDQGRAHWTRAFAKIRRGEGVIREEELGTLAGPADISPESARRFDENADSIALLARHLESRGKHLALLRYRDSAHAWHLLRRLYARGLDLPVIPFFKTVEPWLRLPWDGHPNPRAHRVMALWAARALVDQGWLAEADPSRLQSVPEKYQALRAARHSPEEIISLSDAQRARALRNLTAEVSFETGRGLRQVLGGVGHHAQATTGLSLLLKAEGPRLRLRLEGLADDIAIYPMQVAVQVNAVTVGRLTVQRGELSDVSLPLPREVRPGSAIEVRLNPESWGLVPVQGTHQMGSFLPLSISASKQSEVVSE